jgi:tetratricopeptide (TPR) repeat protein
MGFGEEEESPGLELGPPEPPPSAAPPAAPVVDPELARTVEEIDSYVSLGFVDDAKDALRDALLRFPGAETLAERAKSLGLDVEKEADAASADAHPELSLADPPAAVAAPPDLGFDAPATIPDSPRTAPAAAASSASQSAADVDDAFAFLAGAEPAPDAAVTPAGMKTSVSAAAPVSAGALDLGAELSSLFDPQPAVADPAPDLVDASAEAEAQDGGAQNLGEPGLQDIFNEFKKGVDQALGAEDYDTRYNLGIAYKEMGLIDEAIAEFQLAAKDPKRALECSSMIGICFLEKGVPDVAIQWFEKGLKAPGRAAEEYRGLKYDLASAWEANGDAAIARQIFTELYAEDAGFRDVSDRVRSLKGR